jgi:TIR domain
MIGIAISYRREDTAWITGRIFDRLKAHYEKSGTRGDRNNPVVFMDYDSTPVGVDFRRYIEGVLDECSVLLAVIGPRWIGDDGKGESRIMQESDWVRIEIETALANHIPVVPVLIDRTAMPTVGALPEGMRELVYRQAAIIDTQLDFNSHVDRLIREIDRLLGIAAPREQSRRNWRGLGWLGSGLIALAAGALAALVYFFPSHKSAILKLNNVEANCSSVAIEGDVTSTTITTGGDCSRRAK